MINGYQGQLVGPFRAGQELYSQITADAAKEFNKVNHLGIQAYEGTIVMINYEEFQIGKTGMYEINNCIVTSIRFKEDMDNNTIVDYTIEY